MELDAVVTDLLHNESVPLVNIVLQGLLVQLPLAVHIISNLLLNLLGDRRLPLFLERVKGGGGGFFVDQDLKLFVELPLQFWDVAIWVLGVDLLSEFSLLVQGCGLEVFVEDLLFIFEFFDEVRDVFLD
jgi:hypothetical protein